MAAMSSTTITRNNTCRSNLIGGAGGGVIGWEGERERERAAQWSPLGAAPTLNITAQL